MSCYITVLARVTSWLLRTSNIPDGAIHQTAITLIQNADATGDPVTVRLQAHETKSGQIETLALGRPRIFVEPGGLIGWWIWDAYLLPHCFPKEDVKQFGEDAYLAAAIRIAGTDNIRRVEVD
jgi:hypothetical protein